MVMERESRPGSASSFRPPEGTGRDRGHRLPASAGLGPQTDAHAGDQRVGSPTSECSVVWSDRYREKLVGVCVGPEGLPRWLLGPAQADFRIIPRISGGARGWNHRPPFAPALPCGCLTVG